MKPSMKAGVTILVLAIAAVVATSVLLKNSTNSKLAVQADPTPGATQTPTLTQQPTQATESPSVPTITISYESIQTPCNHYMIDITITNQGYPGFSTDPTKFSVTAGGQKYTYSASLTQQVGIWTTTDVSNEGTYDGTLIFNAPSNVTSASLSYNDASYNIVYEAK